MSNALRDGAAIFSDFVTLTNRMVEQRHDADFLIDGVNKRQAMLEEYQAWAGANPDSKAEYEQSPDTKQMLEKLLAMDKVITKALSELKNGAQKEVAASNAQKKVIGYIAGNISSSGSYLDMKK